MSKPKLNEEHLTNVGHVLACLIPTRPETPRDVALAILACEDAIVALTTGSLLGLTVRQMEAQHIKLMEQYEADGRFSHAPA